MPPAAAAAATDLAQRARQGTYAILATRLLSLAVTAVSITVLARLIAPAHFGIWAAASVALGLVTILREFGLQASIVQARELTDAQRDAYFWTSVGVSLVAAALLALAAPGVAWVYDAAILAPVLWTCCASLVLSGLGLAHAALLRRELAYRKIALVEGGGMLCALIVSVVAALAWRNVWALVAGHVASALWMTVAAWAACRWTPGAPRRQGARIDRGFTFQLAGYNVLAYAANNVGVLAGYRLAAAELGFFNRAQQLYNLAHFALLTPLTEVGFSLLCRLKAEAAYRAAYVALARRVWVLFLPYAAVLPLVSENLVLALLGQDWAPAAMLLAWFAPAVFGQAFGALFAALMMSQGRGAELRRWAIADFALRGAGAAAGAPFGVVGVAAGFSLATALAVPLMAWIAARAGTVKLRHQAAAMVPGLIAAAAAAGAALLAGIAAQDAAPGWGRLAFVGGSAALGWALVCLTLTSAREALLGKESPGA